MQCQLTLAGRILIAASDGSQIPLEQLSTTHFVRGPQVIKSEDTRYAGYVIFDKKDGYSEVNVVEACQEYLERKIEDGTLVLPPGTQKPKFIGNYENEVRSTKKLRVVVPLALFFIFIILYLLFRSAWTTMRNT